MESDILFIQPSFFRGIARTLDFWGQLDDYNYSPSEKHADNLAYYNDLLSVHRDFEFAFEQIRKDIEQARQEVEVYTSIND